MAVERRAVGADTWEQSWQKRGRTASGLMGHGGRGDVRGCFRLCVFDFLSLCLYLIHIFLLRF